MGKLEIITIIFTFLTLTVSGGKKNNKTGGYEFKSIYTNPKSLTLEVGEKEQITAAAVPAVAVFPVFKWVSADNDITTVNNQGGIEALSEGETTITVSTADISATVPVKVNPIEQPTCTYSDTIFKITLKGSDCSFADSAVYGVYIPTLKKSLKGVLVLQHGCGMERFGITRPYDLQYEAFAQKWNLAVIETALYGNCRIWSKPSSGSADALFEILKETGNKTAHPELNAVPWLLFGHSGGGYWTLAMLKAYPERIMAAVCYSAAWVTKSWEYPEAAAKVPLFLRHAGANDYPGCQKTAIQAFSKLREMDSPVSIAYNKGQNHNYSYLRYMAIPFYEAVMKQRMPEGKATEMRNIDHAKTWLGDTLSFQIYKESEYTGNKKRMCLFPDETTAKDWKEYVSTGTVTDKTPPPAPFNLEVKWKNNALEVTWEADADIESGISLFNIYKNGNLIGKLPGEGIYQHFDTNGDNTIPVNVPDMKFKITGTENTKTSIGVETVNNFNLPSGRAEITYK